MHGNELRSGFDLPPGSPRFNPGWKIRDPGGKDPQKVQNGRYSAIDRPIGKQSRAPAMETPQTIF